MKMGKNTTYILHGFIKANQVVHLVCPHVARFLYLHVVCNSFPAGYAISTLVVVEATMCAWVGFCPHDMFHRWSSRLQQVLETQDDINRVQMDIFEESNRKKGAPYLTSAFANFAPSLSNLTRAQINTITSIFRNLSSRHCLFLNSTSNVTRLTE